MPRRTRPIARQWPLAVAAAYASGLWLAGWALVASVRLVVAPAQWRQFGLPEHGWIPWLALLPLLVALRSGIWPVLAWCVLGSVLMMLPVARVTHDIRKGSP